MALIWTLNGPNLNLLGTREPEIYGNETLGEINKKLIKYAKKLGYSLETYQTNAEHELIERIQSAPKSNVDYIIINSAAWTHTSVALRDALASVAIPFIEVHLSNIYARESFRHHSYLSELASGVICGLGSFGYELAIMAIHQQLTRGV